MASGDKLKQAVEVVALTSVLSLGAAACADAAPAPREVVSVHIDDGALKNGETGTATPTKRDCYSAARGPLSRVFNKVAKVVAPLVENGTTGSIKLRTHQYDSGYRVTLTDKTFPSVHTYVVYPEGQYGQIDTTHPLEVGYKGVQKHTGDVNTVALKKDLASGVVDLKAVIGYDSYKEDLESNYATIDTRTTDCATAERFPAGAVGTVNEDRTLVEYDGVYPALVLQQP